MKASLILCLSFVALAAAADKVSSDKAQLKEFEKWLRDNGATFSGDVAKFVEGRGLRVLEDLNTGDVILDVPQILWITAESANRTSYGPIIQQLHEGKHIDETQAVALHLLTEKYNTSSFWKPWLDILPLDFDTPLYYPVEDLQEMVGTSALDIRDKQVKIIESLQKVVEAVGEQNPDVFPKDLFTQATIAWALSTIWSRAANGPDFPGGIALIPLVDMLNHRDDGHIANFTEVPGSVIFRASKPVNLGEQVYQNYGARTNSQLLATYGFIPDRRDDFLLISYAREPQTPFDLTRSYVLHQRNCFDGSSNSRLISGTPLAHELLYCLRIAVMDASDYDKAVGSWSLDKIFSLDNELRMLRSLRGILKSMLDKFTTTIEADAEQLRDSSLSRTRKNALQLRVSEKTVLKHGLQQVEQRWNNFLLAPDPSPEQSQQPQQPQQPQQQEAPHLSAAA